MYTIPMWYMTYMLCHVSYVHPLSTHIFQQICGAVQKYGTVAEEEPGSRAAH